MLRIYDDSSAPDKDDQHETNLAVLAEAHECLQPIEAGRTSCDRRGDKFITQLSKRINVQFPETTTLLGGHIGLARYLGPEYVSCDGQFVKSGNNLLIPALDF